MQKGDGMKTAFGLDIAGYSTGKSGFARADLIDKNHIEVTVYQGSYQGHAFAKKRKGKEEIKKIVKEEKEILEACFSKGPIFVDIPIDLQDLPCPKDVKYVWELINRPVDFAFDALPPLANFIGSPVARFLNLYSSIKEEFKDPLGKQIFETYPAGSLYRLNSQIPNLPYDKYKDQETEFSNGIWKNMTEESKKKESKKEGNLFQIANCLELASEKEKEITISDDDLDAIICAITGVVDEIHLLQGDELRKEINRLISNGKQYPAPKGYVLLKSLPNMKRCIKCKEVTHEELLKEMAR
jgi:hypothetical protein